MAKGGLSIGWLYLVLFILVVSLLVTVIVPPEQLPTVLQQNLAKKLRSVSLPSFSNDCSSLGESACLKNMHRGCVPKYTERTRAYLDCTDCPQYPTCRLFLQEQVCVGNPCGLECRWAVGRFEQGQTITGRCVDNKAREMLKKDMMSIGFTGELEFGSGQDIEKVEETDEYIVYESAGDRLIVDKEQSLIYIESEGRIIAYGKDGSVVADAQRFK